MENWKKLLEEANGELEEKIRGLFLKRKEKDCAREGERERDGGVIGSKDVFVFGEENSRECGKSEKSE